MCNLRGLPRSGSNMRVLLQHPHIVGIDDDVGSAEISVVGEPSSACLWAMVNDFLEVDNPVAGIPEDERISWSAPLLHANSSDAILKRAIQEMESIFGSSGHHTVAAKVASCVAKALNSKSSIAGIESSLNERVLPVVLKHLRTEGYDAGLCTTARKPCNAPRFPPAGGHQYIDVIMEETPVSDTLVGKRPSERLIVDVGFCAHFEIARPLPAYQKLIAMLPSTFVGKAAVLQRVARIMSQAIRASLESQDMAIPPWRSFSFLLAKWFSPSCTRITSVDEAKHSIPSNTSSSAIPNIHNPPCVLAELDYNTNSTNITHRRPVNGNCKADAPKSVFWQASDTAKPWYRPASSNQISSNDSISSYSKKRSPVNVVSALALAFAETRCSHMSTENVLLIQ